MNSLILQQQEEVIALAQFDIKDAVLKKCLLKEGETVIAVPDGVTTIGKDALCSLQSVIAVTLPESLKVINDGAFYGCSSLTSVTLPGCVERLGSCAFAQCSALNTIYLDNKLTEIGNSAFWGCTSLESIDIPAGITKIGYNLFGSCLSLISVSLPDTVTELDERAFKECTSLACITLPDSLTKIGNMPFLNCHNLKSVNIPDRLESIGEKAFFMCESVTVRSTISGKPLYKAVTATDGSSAYNFILRNIWGKDGFDFAAQDNYFPALQDENLQYAIAFSRLMYRVNLSASAAEHYLDFLHNNAENAVRYCITQDSAELLGICRENGLITAGNVTGLIEFADEQGNTSAAAFLLTVANSPEHDNFCDPLSSLEL